MNVKPKPKNTEGAKLMAELLKDENLLQFSKQCGVHRVNLIEYRDGVKLPGLDNFLKILKAKGIEINPGEEIFM